MDRSKYLAKQEKTIEEHANDLINVLKKLVELGYIQDKHLISLVKSACMHHDDGKANEAFQNRIKTNSRYDDAIEVPHNVLSGYLLDPKEYDSDDDYYCVLFAILYHHNYGDPYEIAIDKKELIKKLLNGFEYHVLKRRVLNNVVEKANDPVAIKIKGYLHKCDYSASGGYDVEYPNDFLKSALENVKNKWRKLNPQSDWNDLQRFAMEHSNDNVMMIAQTGMGKTEAGLHWIGNHKGYFVLPLRTAINAMYDRIAEDILLHEKVNKRLSILHSDSLEYYVKNYMSEEMDILEYEKQGKRFAMPLNISTMDQMFDFVFRYQGYEIKLITFAYSKVVIDEIQMYDPEMLAYLIFGLKKIVDFGGKVAIMTATLSPFIRELLKKEIPFKEDCIGMFANDLVRHNVKVSDNKMSSEEILDLYYQNEEEDRSNKILVVCNTIKKAQEIYRSIRQEIQDSNRVHILHSRYTRLDRIKKEKEILEFGKTYNDQGDIDKRSGIWVSTSLVEASLDIDFDYLFTELQDLNSLFQRMGRCNRKGIKDTNRYNCFVSLQNSNQYIDPTIWGLSRKAMLNVKGIISEKDKMELIETYFTMDNLCQSEYFCGKKGYNGTMEWIRNIDPYQYEKNENKLRNILTVDIIPNEIFEQNQETIRNAIEVLSDKSISYMERYKAREIILQNVVTIPYWHWVKYQKAISNNLAMKYPEIKLGLYEKVPVMECKYDETGYDIMNYEETIREVNFL